MQNHDEEDSFDSFSKALSDIQEAEDSAVRAAEAPRECITPSRVEDRFIPGRVRNPPVAPARNKNPTGGSAKNGKSHGRVLFFCNSFRL